MIRLVIVQTEEKKTYFTVSFYQLLRIKVSSNFIFLCNILFMGFSLMHLIILIGKVCIYTQQVNLTFKI